MSTQSYNSFFDYSILVKEPKSDNDKKIKGYFITHDELTQNGPIKFILKK